MKESRRYLRIREVKPDVRWYFHRGYTEVRPFFVIDEQVTPDGHFLTLGGIYNTFESAQLALHAEEALQ
jgi:hypothetical protein